MGVLTTLLKLLKPGENDFYNQQTEQADNWDKVDDYAVLTNTDKNGIWGGEYGGKIQDPIPKELNKRYIDNINGKAYICIKAGDSSVTSNTTEYFTPCNVVDNLNGIQTMFNSEYVAGSKWSGVKKRIGVNLVEFFCLSSEGQENKNIILPDYVKRIIYIGLGVQGNKDTSNSIVYSSFIDRQTITKNSFIIVPRYTGGILIQSEPVYFHAICEI